MHEFLELLLKETNYEYEKFHERLSGELSIKLDICKSKLFSLENAEAIKLQCAFVKIFLDADEELYIYKRAFCCLNFLLNRYIDIDQDLKICQVQLKKFKSLLIQVIMLETCKKASDTSTKISTNSLESFFTQDLELNQFIENYKNLRLIFFNCLSNFTRAKILYDLETKISTYTIQENWAQQTELAQCISQKLGKFALSMCIQFNIPFVEPGSPQPIITEMKNSLARKEYLAFLNSATDLLKVNLNRDFVYYDTESTKIIIETFIRSYNVNTAIMVLYRSIANRTSIDICLDCTVVLSDPRYYKEFPHYVKDKIMTLIRRNCTIALLEPRYYEEIPCYIKDKIMKSIRRKVSAGELDIIKFYPAFEKLNDFYNSRTEYSLTERHLIIFKQLFKYITRRYNQIIDAYTQTSLLKTTGDSSNIMPLSHQKSPEEYSSSEEALRQELYKYYPNFDEVLSICKIIGPKSKELLKQHAYSTLSILQQMSTTVLAWEQASSACQQAISACQYPDIDEKVSSMEKESSSIFWKYHGEFGMHSDMMNSVFKNIFKTLTLLGEESIISEFLTKEFVNIINWSEVCVNSGIDNMCKSLSDNLWSLGNKYLYRTFDEKYFGAVEEMSRHSNPRIKASALMCLGYAQNKKAKELAEVNLYDHDCRIRVSAMRTFCKLANRKQATDKLIEKLSQFKPLRIEENDEHERYITIIAKIANETTIRDIVEKIPDKLVRILEQIVFPKSKSFYDPIHMMYRKYPCFDISKVHLLVETISIVYCPKFNSLYPELILLLRSVKEKMRKLQQRGYSFDTEMKSVPGCRSFLYKSDSKGKVCQLLKAWEEYDLDPAHENLHSAKRNRQLRDLIESDEIDVNQAAIRLRLKDTIRRQPKVEDFLLT